MNTLDKNTYLNREERKALLFILFLCFTFMVYKHYLPLTQHQKKVEFAIHDGLFSPKNPQAAISIVEDTTQNTEYRSSRNKSVHPSLTKPIEAQKTDNYKAKYNKENSPKDTLPYVYQPPTKKSKVIIDINTASEVELQYLRGIGPAYAKRIIKYRDMLGGFYHTQQLSEVYGFDADKLEKIKDKITVSDNLKTINLNSDNIKDLKHPYISYQQAKVIKAYREMHGPFTKANQLLDIKVLDKYFVERIKPYLPKKMH